jgi:hypothetical protein
MCMYTYSMHFKSAGCARFHPCCVCTLDAQAVLTEEEAELCFTCSRVIASHNCPLLNSSVVQ